MKTRTTPPAFDLTRRRLVLSLPGSLAMASPLAFVACGGDGGDGDPEAERAARVKAIGERLPTGQRATAALAITLPAGAAVALAECNLVTANNVAQVAADGTSGAVLVEGGAQLAYLFDKAGRLLLLGVVEPGADQKVDSRSTAEALVLLASQVQLLGDAPAAALRQALRSHELVLPVQRAVEAAAARNGIDAGDTALMAALDGALKTLFPRTTATAGRVRPNAVTLAPADLQSGVRAATVSGAFNTVQFENTFRRRTHVWVAREGQTDDNGAYTAATPPVPLKDFDLNATTPLSFDNFVVAVGDFLAELAENIGALGPYDAGTAPWRPVSGDALELPVPAGASGAKYSARVVGVGASSGGTLSAAEQAKLDELRGLTLYHDFLVPLVKTLILPLIGEKLSSASYSALERFGTNVLLSGAIDLTSMTVANQTLPATAASMRASDAMGVIVNLLSEFLGGNTFQTLLTEILTALTEVNNPRNPLFSGALDVYDKAGNLVGVNLLNDAALMRRNIDRLQGAATKLARIVAIAKALATGADFAAMAKDWSASASLAVFTLDAAGAKVNLTPAKPEVVSTAGTAGTAAITAAIQGLDAGLEPANVFLSWHCTGRYGNLYERAGAGVDDFESLLTEATHDYIPTGIDDDPAAPDTVTVTAYYRNPRTNQRVQLGLATVSITFKKPFSLSITPPGPNDLPANITLPLMGFVNEVLPTGTTVEWTWSHAGNGTLGAAPTNGNARDSSVDFATGNTEGSATVTVSARIHVPAVGTTAAYSVTTNPARATFNVKKGLRQFTFQAPGGVFPCGPTCGVTDYTAFIVPRYPQAVLYTAVFSEFGYGPCNRSVSWTTEKGDGGGCNFPITYHPFSAREAAKAWAVWIGFGGPLTGPGKCMVTVTVPA